MVMKFGANLISFCKFRVEHPKVPQGWVSLPERKRLKVTNTPVHLTKFSKNNFNIFYQNITFFKLVYTKHN
jgi:hypothetical protein